MLKAFFLDIAPWIAYLFFAIAPLLQAWRLYQRKTSHDVSLGYFTLALAAQAMLLPRLMLITGDTLVLTGHLATIVTNIVVISFAIYYRKPRN